jgi:hypothetical protein
MQSQSRANKIQKIGGGRVILVFEGMLVIILNALLQ